MPKDRPTVPVPVFMLADEAIDKLAESIRGEYAGHESLSAGAIPGNFIRSRPYFQTIIRVPNGVAGEVIVAPPQANMRIFAGDVFITTAQVAASGIYLRFMGYGENTPGGEREFLRVYPNEDYALVVKDFVFPLAIGEGFKIKSQSFAAPATLFVQWWKFPTTTPRIIDIATAEIKDLA